MKTLAFAIFIAILLIVLLDGCCSKESVRETITTEYDTVYVPIQGRIDTVTLRNDFTGESIRYVVRVDTLLKKVFVNAKPETLKVVTVDTLRLKETVVSQIPFKDKILYALGGMVLMIVFVIVISVIGKFKLI